MAIAVMFECGHWVSMKGDENPPRCHCGNGYVARVDAPAPTFRGQALGPCAEYQDLPAKPVTLKKDT